MSNIFHNRKANFFGGIFLLAAILYAAFSPPVFAAGQETPETVYCPLTHRFQPIKAQKTAIGKPFGEICASDKLKNEFSAELLSESAVKSLELNPAEVSKLAFDFWRDGKSAFNSAPHKSDSSEQIAAKNSFFTITSGSRDESRIVFKVSQKFIFQTKPRPPTIEISAAFDFQTLRTLKKFPAASRPALRPFSRKKTVEKYNPVFKRVFNLFESKSVSRRLLFGRQTKLTVI